MRKNKKLIGECVLNAIVVFVGIYFLACWLNIISHNMEKHPKYATWNIMAKEISHDVSTKSVKATITSVDLDTETVYVSYKGNIYGYKANGEIYCNKKVTVVFNASMEIIDVR